MSTFGTRLHDAMAARGRLCVGIDPHASLLRGWGLDDDVVDRLDVPVTYTQVGATAN